MVEVNRELMVELHSSSCRCKGSSYIWAADTRSCRCSPEGVPEDAIVLGMQEWIAFRKPRTAEESTSRGARNRGGFPTVPPPTRSLD